MIILQVFIKIKPGMQQQFIDLTRDNCENSLREEGIYRFDLYQHEDDDTRFTLVEAYRDVEAQDLHKQTEHYERWRTQAEPLMAEPRTRQLYRNIYPADNAW